MSSYNENLHSNVIASLQTQELELKKTAAKKNASMFTLYYAEGATLKASEELEETQAVLANKKKVKTIAVTNTNISNNLVDSAGQASVYVKQSITNSAVCAANVQLASNSIVRLASDLGSIYGIVNAADNKTDMFDLADEARRLINKTANEAEMASKHAMEASIMTSEVTASTVQDKAKANSDLMNTVFKITSDEFTAASQLVVADNATLASVSAVEKLSEGDYLDTTVNYKSTKNAYQATNNGLNLGLSVTAKTSTDFTIGFTQIKLPFKALLDKPQVKTAVATNPYYPVKQYYFLVVKDSKKSTFSISNAENILIHYGPDTTQPLPLNSTTRIIPLQKPATLTPPNVSQPVNFQEMAIDSRGPYTVLDSDGDKITLGTRYVVFVLALYTDDYKKSLNSFDEFLSAPSPSFKLTNKLVAVDGSTIKIIPSVAFTAANAAAVADTAAVAAATAAATAAAAATIAAANAEKTPMTPEEKAAADAASTAAANAAAIAKTAATAAANAAATAAATAASAASAASTPPSVPFDYLLNFTVAENPDNVNKVEYRCIFLPPNDPDAGQMNKESALFLNQEVEALEAIAEEFEPQIAHAQAEVIETANHLIILKARFNPSIQPKQTQAQTGATGTETQQVTAAETEQVTATADTVLKDMTTKNTNAQARVDRLKKEMNDKISAITSGTASGNVGFLFNQKLAEQVLAGNYITAINSQPVAAAPASATTATPSSAATTAAAKKTKAATTDSAAAAPGDTAAPAALDADSNPLFQWDVQIAADVTDNFGTPLIPDQVYTPVIVSFCTAAEDNLPMFSNNWSGYTLSTPFMYKPTSSNSVNA